MNTKIFTDEKLPQDVKIQILDFLRIVWPDGFERENLSRDWIDKPENHPLHFVTITETNLLVSYVGIVWKELFHQKMNYITYGLSGVFTYPQFRNNRYGLSLVDQATNHIKTKTNADIILFPSKLSGYYEKVGYEKIEEAVMFEGPIDGPKKVEDPLFMQFVSDKSRNHRQDFINHPIYFGEDIW